MSECVSVRKVYINVAKKYVPLINWTEVGVLLINWTEVGVPLMEATPMHKLSC